MILFTCYLFSSHTRTLRNGPRRWSTTLLDVASSPVIAQLLSTLVRSGAWSPRLRNFLPLMISNKLSSWQPTDILIQAMIPSEPLLLVAVISGKKPPQAWIHSTFKLWKVYIFSSLHIINPGYILVKENFCSFFGHVDWTSFVVGFVHFFSDFFIIDKIVPVIYRLGHIPNKICLRQLDFLWVYLHKILLCKQFVLENCHDWV